MATFIKVAETAGFEPGTLRLVEVSGHSLAIANVDGAFHAIESACTHKGGPLAEGQLSGRVLTCPWHGGQFDVSTGEVLNAPPEERVKSYPVKVEGGDLLVQAPD